MVLRQPDFREVYGHDLLTADSLVVSEDKGIKGIYFDEYIVVTYKNALEDPAYVIKQYPVRKPWFQRSFVTLVNQQGIVFDENGNYFDPQHFLSSGYWAWSEKIANSLPLDYQPARQ